MSGEEPDGFLSEWHGPVAAAHVASTRQLRAELERVRAELAASRRRVAECEAQILALTVPGGRPFLVELYEKFTAAGTPSTFRLGQPKVTHIPTRMELAEQAALSIGWRRDDYGFGWRYTSGWGWMPGDRWVVRNVCPFFIGSEIVSPWLPPARWFRYASEIEAIEAALAWREAVLS